MRESVLGLTGWKLSYIHQAYWRQVVSSKILNEKNMKTKLRNAADIGIGKKDLTNQNLRPGKITLTIHFTLSFVNAYL